MRGRWRRVVAGTTVLAGVLAIHNLFLANLGRRQGREWVHAAGNGEHKTKQPAPSSVPLPTLPPEGLTTAMGDVSNSVVVHPPLPTTVLRAGPPRARMCYTILASGTTEVGRLARLMPLIYATDSYYAIHLDVKTPAPARARLRNVVIAGRSNVELLEPAMPVTWGGLSVLLAALFGLGRCTRWGDWDYWINLSASDMPLMTQDEISLVLGTQKADNVSFISGALHMGDWDEETNHRRAKRTEFYYEDRRLFHVPKVPRKPFFAVPDDAFFPLGRLARSWKEEDRVRRPDAEHFQVYKGDFWVVLHRSFAEYVQQAPDNAARLLLNYMASVQVPDEMYFHTVACHPRRPAHMPVLRSTLRSIPPFKSGPHPVAWTANMVAVAVESGMLFSRKFRAEVRADAPHVRYIAEALEKAKASGETAGEEEAGANGTVGGGGRIPERVSRSLEHIQSLKPLCVQDWVDGDGRGSGGGGDGGTAMGAMELDPNAIGYTDGVSKALLSTTSSDRESPAR
ncbi:unnamed protein product [Phaeothamnion confervicola]